MSVCLAPKHSWKRHLEPFFPSYSLGEPYGISKRTMRINWLDASEEDPLVCTVGNEDNIG